MQTYQHSPTNVQSTSPFSSISSPGHLAGKHEAGQRELASVDSDFDFEWRYALETKTSIKTQWKYGKSLPAQQRKSDGPKRTSWELHFHRKKVWVLSSLGTVRPATRIRWFDQSTVRDATVASHSTTTTVLGRTTASARRTAACSTGYWPRRCKSCCSCSSMYRFPMISASTK